LHSVVELRSTMRRQLYVATRGYLDGLVNNEPSGLRRKHLRHGGLQLVVLTTKLNFFRLKDDEDGILYQLPMQSSAYVQCDMCKLLECQNLLCFTSNTHFLRKLAIFTANRLFGVLFPRICFCKLYIRNAVHSSQCLVTKSVRLNIGQILKHFGHFFFKNIAGVDVMITIFCNFS
jgi:hypothetical protein